ncbi:MAG: efflux RND transporter periplasmic adaptor subunit [Candidatus Berkiellales bacterium]
MRPRINKKFIAILIIIPAIYFTYNRFSSSSSGAHGGFGQAAPVSVAEVITRDVQQWKEFSGRLVAVDHVEIYPRVSGHIDGIYFKSGSLVQKGDLLFTLDARPYAAEAARTHGNLVSMQAQVTLTRSDLNRAERLLKDKVISQSEFETRKNALDVSEANLKSAKAALDAANLNLEYTKIKSPITGKISRPEITLGNFVGPGLHKAILATVVSNSPIYADFEVDEDTFLQFGVNLHGKHYTELPVLMGLASDNGTPRIGRIDSFDNSLNTASGTIRVRAVFDNPNHDLLPGLFARIKVGNPSTTNSILITERAIGTDQNKKFVLIVDKESKVAYREITLGTMVDGLRIVENGLKLGDKIIVNGLQRARPGMPVVPELVPMEIKEAAAEAPAEQNKGTS